MNNNKSWSARYNILTQFDKTLTVKLDIKIPYSKAVQHRVSFEQILPPPSPKNMQTKTHVKTWKMF